MTVGVSPKAKLATLLPAIAALVAVLIQWAVTGEFDRAELATALTGLSTSVFAFLGAYLGSPGEVIGNDVGEGSDARMSATTAALLNDIEPAETDPPAPAG